MLKRGLLLLLVLLSSVTAFKLQAYEERSYYYFQYSVSYSLKISLDATYKSVNADGTPNITNNKLTLRPFESFYNNNIIFGRRWVNGWGVELEWASTDIYFDTLNGVDATNRNLNDVFVKVDYNMVNLKRDIFSLGDFVMFSKLGIGFGQVNQPARNAGGEGGNDIEFAYQGALGAYYIFNKHIDFEIFAKYFRNFASLDKIASIGGIAQKLQYSELNLYASFRFKF